MARNPESVVGRRTAGRKGNDGSCLKGWGENWAKDCFDKKYFGRKMRFFIAMFLEL